MTYIIAFCEWLRGIYLSPSILHKRFWQTSNEEREQRDVSQNLRTTGLGSRIAERNASWCIETHLLYCHGSLHFASKKNCHETVCIRPYVLYTSGQFLAGVLPAHFQYTSISNTLLIYIRFASGIVPVFFWFIKYVFNSGPPDLHSALHPYLNDFMLEIYKFRFQHACNFFKKLVSIWYEKLDLCLYKPGHFHESTTSFPMWHSYIWCASAHRLPSTRTQSPYFITQLSRWWWRVIRYRTEGVVPV